MHNFYLSRKKRGRKKRFPPRRYTIITFSRDASSFSESKYIFERILSGKFRWKRVPRELHPLFYPSDAENIWGTITKQPVKIRETPERNWGLVGRHDRKILVSRRATLLNSLSLSFFFSLLPNYRHSKFSFMTDIHPRRLVSFTSPARCNCFRFETFELYLTSLTSAQSELPTRTLFYAISCQPERMSRLLLGNIHANRRRIDRRVSLYDTWSNEKKRISETLQ